MPSYFFDTDHGERKVRDDIGTTLDTADDAASLPRDLFHIETPTGRRMMTVSICDTEDTVMFRSVMAVTGRRYELQ